MADITKRLNDLERHIDPEKETAIVVGFVDPDDPNVIHQGTLEGPTISREEWENTSGGRTRIICVYAEKAP